MIYRCRNEDITNNIINYKHLLEFYLLNICILFEAEGVNGLTSRLLIALENRNPTEIEKVLDEFERRVPPNEIAPSTQAQILKLRNMLVELRPSNERIHQCIIQIFSI